MNIIPQLIPQLDNYDGMLEKIELKLRHSTNPELLLIAYVQYMLVSDMAQRIRETGANFDQGPLYCLMNCVNNYAAYIWNKMCVKDGDGQIIKINKDHIPHYESMWQRVKSKDIKINVELHQQLYGDFFNVKQITEDELIGHRNDCKKAITDCLELIRLQPNLTHYRPTLARYLINIDTYNYFELLYVSKYVRLVSNNCNP